MPRFTDDPRFLSGWVRDYFCDEDGGHLIFDIERPDYHECVICGKVYGGYIYDCCHITMLRAEAAVNTLKAALVYQACGKDVKYLENVKHIISFYADNYDRLPYCDKKPVPDDTSRTGRIMTQAAEEAVFTIKILCAMELVKTELGNEWLISVKYKLFTKIHSLLVQQRNSIHHDSCWINAALGIMGLFFSEPDWINEALEKEYGLYDQLEKGVTPDGFWYEGSIQTGFSALEGITCFFAFASAYGYEVSEFVRRICMYMLDAGYKYAFDNGVLPVAGDCWPNVTLKTYEHCYWLARKAFGDVMDKYLYYIESLPDEYTPLSLGKSFYYENKIPLERLLFASDFTKTQIEIEREKRKLEKRGSKSYERGNAAVLRSGSFNVFFKYGHVTSQNTHYDKMNIEIMAGNKMLVTEPGIAGYASRINNDWYKSGMAHNTCVVDGMRSDVTKPGRLLYFDGSKIIAECDPYDQGSGIIFRRSIELKDNTLIDDFHVEFTEDSPEEKRKPPKNPDGYRIEWFLHLGKPVNRRGLKLAASKAYKGPYFIDPFEIYLGESDTLNLDCGDSKMRIRLSEGTKAYICSTFSNPPNKRHDTIILCTLGMGARFRNEILFLGD